jgi:hypothetical protein
MIRILRNFVIMPLLLFCGIALVIYFFFGRTVYPQTLHGGPLGTLYVSMAESAPEGYVDSVSAYSYLVGEQNAQFTSIFNMDPIPTLQTKLRNKTGDMFFVYVPKTPSLVLNEGEYQDATTTVGASGDDETFSEAIKGAGGNIAMTNFFTGGLTHVLPEDNTLTGERSLAWSTQAGLLAFAAQDMTDQLQTGESTTTNEDFLSHPWHVYIANPDTKEVQKVGDGLDPQWSPDGTSLIFLGVDGLYQYSRDTKETRAVVTSYNTPSGFEEKMNITENMNIALSSDGKLLAVSSPNQHSLFFFDVLGWSPFTLQTSAVVAHKTSSDMQYYWPTFSPDNAHIAVQVANRDVGGNQINPRIEIFNLKTGEPVESIGLKEFDFEYSFIDDWGY